MAKLTPGVGDIPDGTLNGVFKNYTELTQDNVSPGRIEPSIVFPAISVVANYVERIPEVDVKFEADMFMLSTQTYAPATEQVTTEANLQAEMDSIVTGIIQELKENQFPKAKAEYVNTQFDGMGWGYNGQKVLFVIRSFYQLSV